MKKKYFLCTFINELGNKKSRNGNCGIMAIESFSLNFETFSSDKDDLYLM